MRHDLRSLILPLLDTAGVNTLVHFRQLLSARVACLAKASADALEVGLEPANWLFISLEEGHERYAPDWIFCCQPLLHLCQNQQAY